MMSVDLALSYRRRMPHVWPVARRSVAAHAFSGRLRGQGPAEGRWRFASEAARAPPDASPGAAGCGRGVRVSVARSKL